MARQERARGAAGRGSAGSHGRLLLLLRGGGAKASALFLGCLCLAHFAGSVSVLAAAAAVESPPAGLAVYRCPVPDSLRADFVALAEAADLDVWGTRHRKPPKKGRRGRGREGGAGKAGKVNSSVPVVVFRGTESARDAVEALTELPCTTQVADLAAHVRKNIKEIDSIEADDTDTYLDHAPADHDNGEEDNDNDDSDSDEAYGARAYLARKRRIWTKAAFFQTFRRYPAVVQYLKQIAANPPDGVDASLYSVGKSIKNRDIWVMRVTSKRGGSQKKQIWWAPASEEHGIRPGF